MAFWAGTTVGSRGQVGRQSVTERIGEYLRRVLIAALALLSLELALGPIATPRAAQAQAPLSPGASTSFAFGDRSPGIPNVWVYVPKTAKTGESLQPLIAMHGMGGKGQPFAAPLVEFADRHKWLLIAPDFAYRDWRDPQQVRTDEMRLTPGLITLTEALPDKIGWEIQDRLLLFGFSRGAQLATRFSLFYPEHVLAVAAVSAGTYTVPRETWTTGGQEAILPLPFGVGDLSRTIGRSFDLNTVKTLHFWVAVGGNDNATAELPKDWDPYLGSGRINRAETFVRYLKEAGVDASLHVFNGIGHAFDLQMLTQATEFLRGHQLTEATQLAVKRAGNVRLQPLANIAWLPAEPPPAAALPRAKACGW